MPLLSDPNPSSERVYWLSSEKMTVTVEVVDGKITRAAPIVRKFVGQSVSRLIDWMGRQGGLKVMEIPDSAEPS